MFYFAWSDGRPFRITKSQFDTLLYCFSDLLPDSHKYLFVKKNFKNEQFKVYYTHFYYDDVVVFSLARCY